MRAVRRYVNAGSLFVLGLIVSCGAPERPLALQADEVALEAGSPAGSPAAPFWPYAKPNSSTEIEVVWSDSSTNEDGFRVERSTDNGASWAMVATIRGQRFTDRERVTEQEACYRVTAFNNEGGSPPSSTSCTTPPAAPALFALVPINGDTLEIVWLDLSAIEDGYEVRYIDPGFAGQALLAVLPPNSTSVRSTAPASQYFTYYIYATKDGGYSDPGWGYLADVWEHRTPIGPRRIDGPVKSRARSPSKLRGPR